MTNNEINEYLNECLSENPRLNSYWLDAQREFDRELLRDMCLLTLMDETERVEFFRKYDEDSERMMAEMRRREEIANRPLEIKSEGPVAQ